ncbi:MAG: acyl-CoA thioesterase [Rhodospirillales bacterium]|nr:acyl-CoA thioesterase [Rhodospirillales bacterium]
MSRSAHLNIKVAWGDCDPAGIVFYPNYFRWIDAATWNLFEQVGNGWGRLQSLFGPFQIPLLDAKCAFRAPCRRGDQLTIESRIVTWERKVFKVDHRLHAGNGIAVEGWETRCWTRPDAEDGGRLRSAPIPDELRALFEEARCD